MKPLPQERGRPARQSPDLALAAKLCCICDKVLQRPALRGASHFLAGRPGAFVLQAVALVLRTLSPSPAAQRAAITQPRAERSDALGKIAPTATAPQGRESGLYKASRSCAARRPPPAIPSRALSGRSPPCARETQGIVLTHSALGWVLTAFQAVLSPWLPETEMRPAPRLPVRKHASRNAPPVVENAARAPDRQPGRCGLAAHQSAATAGRLRAPRIFPSASDQTLSHMRQSLVTAPAHTAAVVGRPRSATNLAPP